MFLVAAIVVGEKESKMNFNDVDERWTMIGRLVAKHGTCY